MMDIKNHAERPYSSIKASSDLFSESLNNNNITDKRLLKTPK